MLVYSAADFEDFREPRPDMPPNMEADLERVVRHLAEVKWPFRLHATYDQTIGRALNVFEKVNKEVPLEGIHWFIDHAETITPRNIDRITALRAWTEANTWFSSEEGKKGAIKSGQLADLAVLSADYMTVPEDQIKGLVSVITIVGGNVVYGDGPFSKLAPPLPPASPDWSPVSKFGGYYRREHKADSSKKVAAAAAVAGHSCSVHGQQQQLAWFADIPVANQGEFWSAFGCSCWMG